MAHGGGDSFGGDKLGVRVGLISATVMGLLALFAVFVWPLKYPKQCAYSALLCGFYGGYIWLSGIDEHVLDEDLSIVAWIPIFVIAWHVYNKWFRKG